MDQIAIAILGALAAWLSQARAESFRRWACIFGILGSLPAHALARRSD